MRRVVITGLGIVSSIGNNAAEVTAALRQGKSGIVHADVYQEMGFRSHVHGAPRSATCVRFGPIPTALDRGDEQPLCLVS